VNQQMAHFLAQGIQGEGVWAWDFHGPDSETMPVSVRKRRVSPPRTAPVMSAAQWRPVYRTAPRKASSPSGSADATTDKGGDDSGGGGDGDDPDDSDLPSRQRSEIEYLRSLTGRKGGILERTYRLSLLTGWQPDE